LIGDGGFDVEGEPLEQRGGGVGGRHARELLDGLHAVIGLGALVGGDAGKALEVFVDRCRPVLIG